MMLVFIIERSSLGGYVVILVNMDIFQPSSE